MSAFSGDQKRQLRVCSQQKCRSRLHCCRSPSSRVNILDLRQLRDFETEHILQSLCSPLTGLTENIHDVFGQAETLHMLWKDLKAKFDDRERIATEKDMPTIVLCYYGDASQVATSILRAKGITAFSVDGGFHALRDLSLARGRNSSDIAINDVALPD